MGLAPSTTRVPTTEPTIFSLSELDDAGVDLDLAEALGLPVDAGRIGAYGPNVTVLRDFVRSSRQPL